MQSTTATLLDEYLNLLDTFPPTRPVEGWTRFHCRQAAESGFQVTVRRQGDKAKGTMLLTFRWPEQGWSVLAPVVRSSGSPMWMPVHRSDWVDEQMARERVQQALSVDPDMWVLEVEGDHPLRNADKPNRK